MSTACTGLTSPLSWPSPGTHFAHPPCGRERFPQGEQAKGGNTYPNYKPEMKVSRGHATCLSGSAHFICMKTQFNIGSSPEGIF